LSGAGRAVDLLEDGLAKPDSVSASTQTTRVKEFFILGFS
jgi:hypothetical protein